MARLILTGVVEAASKYVVRARQQLAHLKQRMAIYGDTSSSLPPLLFPDAVIKVRSHFGEDLIDIQGLGEGEFIVCFIGDTTGDFSSKRFYTLAGKEMGRDEEDHPYHPPGWSLTDDGLYGLIPGTLDPVDPFPREEGGNSYAYDAGGLGIPSSGSGISAKKQAGKKVRYVLNGAIEDETFDAMLWEVSWPGHDDYTYTFVRQIDSLTYAPYSIYGPRPYFTKYLGGSVVTMIVPWAGYDATYMWDAYPGENFRDVIPKVKKIWKVAIEDGERTGIDIVDYGDSNDGVIGAAGFKDGDDIKVNVVRGKTDYWVEPVRQEQYNLTDESMTQGDVFHRCADEGELCYFYDADIDSSKPSPIASSIANDVKIIHSIDEQGEKTYVRIQKEGAFDSVNTGLYCGDGLVEESGFESVLKVHADEAFGPLLIRNTRYRIIHVYCDNAFKSVVYSKTVYVSHSDELIPYKRYVSLPGVYGQVRKNMIESQTTYHAAVNGTITDLGYSHNRREYRLTISKVEYSGPPISTIESHMVYVPWVDAGYDAGGTPLDEDNSCVMRCYTDTSKGKLLLGFDVFPVNYRHDLVYDAHNNLTLEFDEGVIAYPPVSDARYPDVKDRKWLLFGSNGHKIKDLIPPQKPDDGGHVQRINGLAFIGV